MFKIMKLIREAVEKTNSGKAKSVRHYTTSTSSIAVWNLNVLSCFCTIEQYSQRNHEAAYTQKGLA